MTLRFVLTVDDGWTIGLACPDKPGWEPKADGPDRLIRLEDGRGGLVPGPVVDLHDPDAEHEELAASNDPAPVMTAYDVIRGRRASADELARFGHYLFDVLLGPDRWGEIVQLTEAEGHRALELALALPAKDQNLARLNWELMRSPDGFLAAGTRAVRVAITRLVATPGAPPPAPLGVPPKALFVVGTALLDHEIRSAAELSALIRLSRDGRGLRYRILERAKPSEIRDVMREFEPEIVHYIAHGGVDLQSGRVYLELNPEDDSDEQRYAEQILEDLRAAERPATIVVLSACQTGGAPGAERLTDSNAAGSMAEALVAGGIPIVLGMAGSVADLTSRLFARTFAQAIIEGKPLVAATADARSAAFADPGDPVSSVDWALPTIFVSSSVPTGFRPLDLDSAQARWRRIEGWTRAYDEGASPVFCGRENYLAMFQGLFGPNARKRGLAVYTASAQSRMGRSRLLRELAAHAVRDGHLPLLLAKRQEPIRTVDELGRAFLDELSRMRVEVLGIDESVTSQLRMLNTGRFADLDPEVTADMHDEVVTVRAVGRALRLDLTELHREAKSECEYFESPDSRLVVLLDDIDLFGEMAREVLERMFGPYGLGTSKDPIPVVLSWTHGRAGDPWLRELAPGSQSLPWLEISELNPFSEDGEDMIAYKTVLLNPFQPASRPADHVLHRTWVLDEDHSDNPRYLAVLRTNMMGIPDRFHQGGFEVWVQLATGAQVLVPARDEDHLPYLIQGGR